MGRRTLGLVALILIPLVYAVAQEGQVLMTLNFENDFYNGQGVVIPGGSLGDLELIRAEPGILEATGIVHAPDVLRPRGWKGVRKGDLFRFVVTPVEDGTGEVAVTIERTGQTRVFLYNENLEVVGEKK
ncbi:MAG: hypothetical protein MUF10_12385 [Thermoanaerobaculaceae bacterium]|jgi:hypothetical protein|nr:hypothetical protein [Thermoanaerobaculaceae bacterium]